MKKLEKICKKSQKGITLIALVITIIVLLILAGITINMGTQAIKDSKENAVLSELGMVQNAVLQRKTKSDLTNETYPGEVITSTSINLDQVIQDINANKSAEEQKVEKKDNNNGNYYLLTNTNNGLADLGIQNSEDEYIVNYETGEVINYTTKVTETGKPLYIYAREK